MDDESLGCGGLLAKHPDECTVVTVASGDETRVGLQLAQEDIAQMLGASRQRVNQELKGFEREGAVRIEPTRLVVLSKDKLLAIANR